MRRPNLKTCCKRLLPALLVLSTVLYLGIVTIQNHVSLSSTQRMRRGGPWTVLEKQRKKQDDGQKRHKKAGITEEPAQLDASNLRKFRDNSHPPRPHIILITVADLGWNDVGYNNPTVKTPTIDRLATEGVRLDNYYVQSKSAPSKAEILTGRYQIHNGVSDTIQPSDTYCLPSNKITMARVLKDAGYATHLVGQWGLGHSKRECTPTFRGYDTFYGPLTSFSDQLTHLVHWTPRYDKARPMSGYDFYDNDRPIFAARNQYTTQLLTERAQKIIKEHEHLDQPLFLDLSFPSLHIHQDLVMKHEDTYNTIGDKKRRHYLSMVSLLDEAIANVSSAMDELKKQDLWRSYIIVFSSVSGADPREGGSNWPLRGWSGSYWEGGIRAASFLYSSHLKTNVKGWTASGLMSGVDWFPTLAGFLAGGKISMLYLDGTNIWGAVNNVTKIPRRREIVYSVSGDCITPFNMTKANMTSDDIRLRMRYGSIRYRDWKLVLNYPGEAKFSFDWIPPAEMHLPPVPEFKKADFKKTTWLFKLNDDPREKRNMVDLRTDVTEKLLSKLWDYCQTSVGERTRHDDPYADPGLHGGVIGPWIL